MRKYPLTPEGVQAKQDELYKLDDRELLNQAVSIAKDPRSWVFENFDLTDEQAEYYKSLPEDFSYYIGWQIASAVIGRQPIEMGAIHTDVAKQNKKKSTDISIEGTSEYDPQTGHPKYGLTVGVTFHL